MNKNSRFVTENWQQPTNDVLDKVTEEIANQIQQDYPEIFSKGATKLGTTINIDQIYKVISEVVFIRKDILPEEAEKIIIELFGQATGYGVLTTFFIGKFKGIDATEITEIQVNPDRDGNGIKVFYCISGDTYYAGNHFFQTDQDVLRFVQLHCSKVGISFNETNPKVDAWLSDGSRLHAMGFKSSPFGVSFNIRKSPTTRPELPLETLVENCTIPQLMYDIITNLLIPGKAKIGIYGQTDSGKTAFLRAMGKFIKKELRTIIAEKNFELFWSHLENCLNYVTVKVNNNEIISMSDLCDSINRSNAYWAIVSEVLGNEIVPASSIAESASGGFIITGHAGGVPELRSRFQTMFKQGGIELTMDQVDERIASMSNFLIFLDKEESGYSDGSRSKRMLMSFVEVTPKGYNTIIEFDKKTFGRTRGQVRQWIYSNTITEERLGELLFRGGTILPEFEKIPGKYLRPGVGVMPSDNN